MFCLGEEHQRRKAAATESVQRLKVCCAKPKTHALKTEHGAPGGTQAEQLAEKVKKQFLRG